MLCPDYKNVFFGKIHWAPSEILEVAEAIFEVVKAKFWISSCLERFWFRIFVILGFEVVWPQQPRRPQKWPSEFFQKLHFWNQCNQTKKMRYVTTLSSTFSLNLPTEEVWVPCNLFYYLTFWHLLLIFDHCHFIMFPIFCFSQFFNWQRSVKNSAIEFKTLLCQWKNSEKQKSIKMIQCSDSSLEGLFYTYFNGPLA